MRCVGFSVNECFSDLPLVLCSNSRRATHILSRHHQGNTEHMLNSTSLCRYSTRGARKIFSSESILYGESFRTNIVDIADLSRIYRLCDIFILHIVRLKFAETMSLVLGESYLLAI